MTPDVPHGAAVAETHSATVFFFGDHAYKVKKPVDLGFLDFRTREARETICHREVELNRRLAPDVYLGVADITGPNGELCDHMIVMRRMPHGRRLSRLVAAGESVTDEIDDIARVIAAFHARGGRTAEADYATGIENTVRRWTVNTDALVAMAGRHFAESDVATVHGLACRYLGGRAPLFESRIDRGRAVDGHGDLLADDIFCLEDGPRILDCIEFDDQLRVGDALADVAFLAMDLERLGHPDLAKAFLDAYGGYSGDSWPSSLAHHHIAYRAQVRAKVSAIRADQGDPDAGDEARRLLALAADHLEAGRVRLVLVGGLPGTGKSTLASTIADATGAALLRTDEIRKQLAGLDDQTADAPFGEGIYTHSMTDLTYETMISRASVELHLGKTVVLDASWSTEAWRNAARALARETFSDVIELRCEAPRLVAARRIEHRRSIGQDASDATAAIATTMAQRFDDWAHATPIDTTGPTDASLTQALAQVFHRGTRRSTDDR